MYRFECPNIHQGFMDWACFLWALAAGVQARQLPHLPLTSAGLGLNLPPPSPPKPSWVCWGREGWGPQWHGGDQRRRGRGAERRRRTRARGGSGRAAASRWRGALGIRICRATLCGGLRFKFKFSSEERAEMLRRRLIHKVSVPKANRHESHRERHEKMLLGNKD